MEVEDKWTAFQLDSALAVKGFQTDSKINQYHISLINWHILQVCRMLGAKKVPKTPPKPNFIRQGGKPDELPPLSQVLAQLGGTGVVLQPGKKKNG